jgi:hypothetical protein
MHCLGRRVTTRYHTQDACSNWWAASVGLELGSMLAGTSLFSSRGHTMETPHGPPERMCDESERRYFRPISSITQEHSPTVKEELSPEHHQLALRPPFLFEARRVLLSGLSDTMASQGIDHKCPRHRKTLEQTASFGFLNRPSGHRIHQHPPWTALPPCPSTGITSPSPLARTNMA